MPPAGESPDTIPRGMIIAVLLLFIAIIGAGVFFYQSQEAQIRDSVTTELTATAHLKAGQIAAWREERLGDARVLTENQIFIEGVKAYLASPDPAGRQKILSLFDRIATSYHYHNIQLVDPEGRVQLTLDPSSTSLGPQLNTSVADSVAARRVLLTDLTFDPGSGSPRMYGIAPLVPAATGNDGAVGAVILTIDPARDLYPLIQSWPVPSGSAETLLVERDGDHVLFLNELRHRNDTALNLTIPVSQTDVPAVMAVLGTTGSFEGKDYRGIDVISVLEPVSGSPWFMVAKIDVAEAYSVWRVRSALIIFIIAGSLAALLILAGLFWQRRQKYYYRALYAAEVERTREEQRNRERVETLVQLSRMDTAGRQELLDFVLDAGCRLTMSPLAFIGVMSPDESVFDITAWSKSVMNDCSVAVSPIH